MNILNNFYFRLLAGFILFLILGTCVANAKPKPKKYKDIPLPTIIQSKTSPFKINEGAYVQLLKEKKTLTTNLH